VGRFHERVLALAPEGHLDLTRLDEDDARELWLLADVIAFDNGMKWRDEPPE